MVIGWGLGEPEEDGIERHLAWCIQYVKYGYMDPSSAGPSICPDVTFDPESSPESNTARSGDCRDQNYFLCCCIGVHVREVEVASLAQYA